MIEKIVISAHNNNQQDKCEDTLWLIKSDIIHDFKNYFPKHNPKKLSLLNLTKIT